MNHKSLFAAGMLIAATTFGAVAPAFAAGRDLAVLVVGNGSDKEMGQRERSIIEALTRLRLQRGWNHKILPIYSYHFDKTAERSYCEERLKVKAGDLVLVGLVELESGVPIDFVYRETGVANTGTAVDKVMERARAELAARGRLASTTPPSTPSPRPPGTTKPTTAVTAPASPVAATSSPATRPAAPTPPVAHTPAPAAAATPKPTPPPATPKPATPSPASAATITPHATGSPATSSHPIGPVTVTTAPITPVLRPAATTRASTPKPATTAPVATTPKPATPATTATTPKPATTTPSTPKPATASTPAATTPVAVTPATTTPATNEVWAVQLGLFSTVEKARLAIEKMRQAIPDLQAEIRKGSKDGQVVYRVVSGTFGSQADAYARAKALAESGVAGFSVKVDAALGPVVK